VQLNAPRRAVPRAWTSDARGGHAPGERVGARPKTVSPAETEAFAETLRRLSGLEVVTAPAA
jgi:hypothetical protein